MRAPDPLSAQFLLATAKGQTDEIEDWKQLQTRFGVTVTRDIERARSFFLLGVRPRDHFPLNHQWICAANKLVNQVNHDFQQWRRQEAQSLGIVSAFTQLIKPVLNCPGLFESQQIDFIKKIDSPDLPPNDILILEGNPFISLRNIDTRSGLVKGRLCRALQMKNRTVVIQFDNGETRALTRIPWRKLQMG
jgi:hypothetical protein